MEYGFQGGGFDFCKSSNLPLARGGTEFIRRDLYFSSFEKIS
jgi:hypothetical protein